MYVIRKIKFIIFTEITLIFHLFSSHCATIYTACNPSRFVLSHHHNLSFFVKNVCKLWDLMASSGLNFPSEVSHMHTHKTKFICFSPINLSYVSLIIRPVTEPKEAEESFFSLFKLFRK